MSRVTVRAAGAVLWRPDGGEGREIALVHRPRYDDWSLPKGKLQPGEHPLVGACREVAEETGVHAAAGPRLPTVSYPVATKSGTATKVVDYWAMRAAGMDAPFQPNDEVDAVVWLAPGEARARLSYGHDEHVVTALTALPPVTATVLLLRHGHAGERKQWTGDDRLRPLDELGRAQAARLATVLACFAPTRVLSADRVRCVQTVEPLAAALGLEIEIEPDFSEERHADRPKRAASRLRDLAAAGGVTVVCSQGGVIPDSVALLAGADGVKLDRITSPKGSVWVLCFRDRTLVAGDFLPD